jgi:hypothetical protein
MMLGERKDDLNVYLKVPLDPNGANPNVGHIPSVATDSTTPKTSNSTNYMSFYQRYLNGSCKDFAFQLNLNSHSSTIFYRMMHIDASSLMRYLRYINVILATLQAFAGFLGVFDLAVLDITSFFISIYVM